MGVVNVLLIVLQIISKKQSLTVEAKPRQRLICRPLSTHSCTHTKTEMSIGDYDSQRFHITHHLSTHTCKHTKTGIQLQRNNSHDCCIGSTDRVSTHSCTRNYTDCIQPTRKEQGTITYILV